MTKELTGRHVLIIALCAFGVIITANLSMLFAATGSFPGLVVQNSYIASQGWNARADAQHELGWSARISHDGGAVHVALTDSAGLPVLGTEPHLRIGRPTTTRDDRRIDLKFDGALYSAPIELPLGRWEIELTILKPAPFTASTEIVIGEIH